jgi:hypothetical protein
MWHLPDLPNAGYGSRREREASDAIMLFMRDCERDRPRLLAIVCEGPDTWRRVASDLWRGFPISTDLIDAVYKYFVLQATVDKPFTCRALLAAIQNPLRWRELVRCVMPHLERQRDALRLQAKWTPFDRVWGGK